MFLPEVMQLCCQQSGQKMLNNAQRERQKTDLKNARTHGRPHIGANGVS